MDISRVAVRCAAVCYIFSALPHVLAQGQKERPIGLVLSADGAELRRPNINSPLPAKPGDPLFPGDSLVTGERGAASFLFCPSSSSQRVGASADLTFEAQQVRVKKGALADKQTIPYCVLPEIDRNPSDSLQHSGASMTRALNPAEAPSSTFASRLAALPLERRRALLAELEPMDKALEKDPRDLATRIARAALLQKYDLPEDASEEYKRVYAAYPDAVWTRQLVHEIDSPKSVRGAAATDEKLTGKTYAVLVGISKYQRLAESQWLQFAHADAITFADHLKSQRGGSIPPENIVLLTDEQATTAAVRNGIETFLKAKAGKQDTVLLFVAAHGTVEPGHGAYIVTYDSDPENLATTALPMVEIQNLMQHDLARVGRVLVYVDVCRAGTIGTIKSNNVNTFFDPLFQNAEVFGLMASRPREYSFEFPEYGGGHGAFTYFLLRALNGDAEVNERGEITVGAVISYLQEKVPYGTNNRQHPREGGDIGNEVALANAKKDGIALKDWTIPKVILAQTRTRSLARNADPQAAAASPSSAQRLRPMSLDDMEQFEQAMQAGWDPLESTCRHASLSIL